MVRTTDTTYLDFLRGALLGVDRLGWFPPVPPSEAIADRLEASDIPVPQARLNALGYDAGPVDGVVGRRTRATFHTLKRDHCLPEDPGLRPVMPILAAPGPDLTPPPCAPGLFSRIRDVTEPMFTSP